MKSRGWTSFLGIAGAVVALFGVAGLSLLGDSVRAVAIVHLQLGAVLLFIWLASYALPRWNEVRRAALGATVRSAGKTALLLVSVIFAAVAANGLAQWFDVRIDLTERDIHSLASQSVQVSRSLQHPVRIIAFDGLKDFPLERVRPLLELYRRENPQFIHVEEVDPVARPDLVDGLGVKPGEVLYVEFREGDATRVERLLDVSEAAVTGALLRLQRRESKSIYYLIGHGEPDIRSERPLGLSKLVRAIQEEHGPLQPLLLSEHASIPEDAALLVWVGARSPLLPGEYEAIEAYLRAGGRMVILTDPRYSTDAASIGARFGIAVGDDVIVDEVSRPVGAPQLGAQPLVRNFGYHPVTQPFSKDAAAVFNIASSVRILEPAEGLIVDEVARVELLKTSARAWAERNLTDLLDATTPRAEREPDDVPGPVSIGVAAEWISASHEAPGRLVLVGDSDWVLNANLHWHSNRDLILNMIGWAGEIESGVVIRPRSMRESTIVISQEMFRKLFTGSILVPELLLLFGLWVWWRRRDDSLLPGRT